MALFHKLQSVYYWSVQLPGTDKIERTAEVISALYSVFLQRMTAKTCC